MSAHMEQIRAQLNESCRVKQSFSEELLARVETFAVRAAEALAGGRKLVFFGNGGSAADAQHLAAELVVRLHADRPGLSALALTANTSVLTAAAITAAPVLFASKPGRGEVEASLPKNGVQRPWSPAC